MGYLSRVGGVETHDVSLSSRTRTLPYLTGVSSGNTAHVAHSCIHSLGYLERAGWVP
jgi:hypothetical protein